ncbi:DUF748 domain-containing protein [Oleidesulfovibrio alaskensis]
MNLSQRWNTLPRKAKLAILWLAGLLAVWTAGGFFLVPHIARDAVESNLSQALGRNCSVGGMSFNPFTLSVELRDTAVLRKDGSGPFISFRSVRAAPDITTIFYRAPVIRYISIDRLAVSLEFMGKGQYNFSDLMPPSAEARPEDSGQDDAVFPFAVRNFMLTNSSIVFRDTPHGITHTVTDLNLQVPFTSSLAGDRDAPVEPRMNATVNGNAVDFEGRIVPFGNKLRTDFIFAADNIELKDYWQYIPAGIPLELASGRLSTAVNFSFAEQASGSLLHISGNGTLADVALYDGKKKVLGFDAFSYDIGRFSLFEQLLHVRSAVLTKPFADITRSASGQLNWQRYAAALLTPPAAAQENMAPVQRSAAAANATVPKNTDGQTAKQADGFGFSIQLDAASVTGGSVALHDNMVEGGFNHTFGPLDITLNNLSTTGGKGSVGISMQGAGTAALKGTLGLNPLSGEIQASLNNTDLRLFTPYIHQAQPLLLDSGRLSARARASFSAGATLNATVQDAGITLSALELRKQGNKTPSIRIPELTVSGVQIRPDSRQAQVADITLRDGFVRMVREKSGSMDLQRLFTEHSTAGTAEDTAPQENDGSPWSFTVQKAALQNSECVLLDETLPRAARLTVTGINLDVTGAGSDAAAPVEFSFSGNWLPHGRLAAEGSLTRDPLRADVRSSTRNMSLAAFDPYLAAVTDMVLAKGGVDSDLRVSVRGNGMQGIRAGGSVAVRDVLVRDAMHKDGIASLGSLAVNGIAFDGAAETFSAETVRLEKPKLDILREQDGMLNLQRVLRAGPVQVNATAVADATVTADVTGIPEEESVLPQTGADGDVQMRVAVNATMPGAPASDKDSASPAGLEKHFSDVRLGGAFISDGTVHFRDVSVSPPFELTLAGLNATLSSVSLSAASRPDLRVDGRLNGVPLTLQGALNPLVSPPYSDLALRIANLDLVAFSPYSLQGIAYPVKRGRLDVESRFKTEDWLLTSDTRLHVARLALGEKDRRPDAPNYPVELGIALLRGPGGDIDISLPVRGRLDDPNFRVGGIVLQAVVNLVMKAMTSPFALIGGLFGGGEDLDFVAMSAGSTALDAAAEQKISSIATALAERPGLELEIQGLADAVRDRQALEKAAFDLRIKTRKYLDLPRSERAATSPAEVMVTAEEYPEYLRSAYEEEPSDDPEAKPTGLFGIVKDQPVDFMEAFLRRSTAVSDADLGAFALERARAVRQAILALRPDVAGRLLLVQPDITGRQGGKAAQKPGVSLTLR